MLEPTTTQPSRAPHVSAHAEAVLERIDILRNPYFKALQEGLSKMI